ncbi:hypothetical protein QV08_01370 [Gallibacterium salpingitidis]|uniref:SMODS-associating 2TM beta-strand rich effector domain-containing protein n=1 Tax=Gallibacterium salpingitidis TaxID=505341 RepID=A0AB36E3P0_9PAST|nr:hypothetical protein [Gallibacterium salpingitidis]OBX07845.1 hypothetical protein QV09_10330 [Gallibacterium salpingitidis]OBX09610.1 hypothetical protein QV08_01370 [Gallibacterium salpingitidis]WKS98532.1 hypothetical protein NYR30_06980 [Gallibacterium salpingitidis]
MQVNKYVSWFFNIIGPVSSLLGVIGVAFTDLFNDIVKTQIIFWLTIALVLFLFFRIYLVTKQALNRRYPRGYLPIATFARYSTSDGKRIQYEIFRHIQIKQSFKNSFEHDFYWTGSKLPTVSSNMQKVGVIKEKENDDGQIRNVVPLEFKETLLYNSCEVVHILMDIDDSDEKSEPFLSQTVNEPIKSIHFRVELLHAKEDYYCKTANLTCYETAKPKGCKNIISNVKFDNLSKSYSTLVVNPKAGYTYVLSWERPHQ